MTFEPTLTSVQPHLVFQSTIRTSNSLRLTIGNEWRTTEPRATVPKSWKRSGNTCAIQSGWAVCAARLRAPKQEIEATQTIDQRIKVTPYIQERADTAARAAA